jgi:glycosyltransferase involved in cell wall biosynthesis
VSPRTVIVMPTYFPESYGGAEQQARRFSQVLLGLGASVTILAPRINPSSPVRDKEGDVNVRRFRVFRPPNLGGRYFFSFLLWSAWILAWLVGNRRNYDVIHVFHGRLHAVPAVLAGALLRKPTIVKLGRGGDHFDLTLLRGKKVVGPFMAGIVGRFTTGFVANSLQIGTDLEKFGIEKPRVHLIANGINISEQSASVAGEARRLISLGRLDPEKNMTAMIESFARLDVADAELTIVGDGICRAELETAAKTLGVSERVHFVGAVDNVFPYLLNSDYFVSTSESEGMSNALLEAMSCGVVPIVTDVSGASDIVQDQVSGFLVPAGGDFATVLTAACRLPEPSRQAMAQRARQVIESRFSMARIARDHLALYDKLLLKEMR